MSLPQSADTAIAGYRLVRKLGSGSRADAYLGAGSTGTAVLKILHAEVSRDDVGRELDALGRLDSPHCVRLTDVSSAAGELPILILDRVHRGSVASLLRDRDSLEAGEAVTILAPLAGVLPILHGAGVAHTRIGASTVHLGSAGEPVLLGFGHCELFAAGSSIAGVEAEPGAALDRDALAAFVLAVLSRVRGAGGDRRIRDLAEWVERAPRVYEFAEQLEARLFDLAEATPIEFGRGSSAAATVPGRVVALGRVDTWPPTGFPPADSSPQDSPEVVARPGARGDLVAEWMSAAILNNPIAALRERAVSAAKGVRKPLWVVVGGIAAALVLAIALIPQGEPAQTTPVAVVTPRASAVAVPATSATTQLPDDPVLALPLLLAARTTCIRDLSVLCLDDVDEASSAAFTADAAVIRQIQSGEEVPRSAIVTAPSPTLVERLGDAVLIDLGQSGGPASVLMIKDADGWRIRGFLDDKPATPGPTPEPVTPGPTVSP